MPTNSQKSNTGWKGKMELRDDNQLTLTQCYARYDYNESTASSPVKAANTIPFKRSLDNGGLDEEQAVKKATMNSIEDANIRMIVCPNCKATLKVKNHTLLPPQIDMSGFEGDDEKPLVAVKPDEGKGSKHVDVDNSDATFEEGAHDSKVEEFNSEDENSIIENLAKKYGEDDIIDNSDEDAIPGRFRYEDGPIYRPHLHYKHED